MERLRQKSLKPPKCRLCETLHWSHEPHKFAINTIDTAINTAINTDDIAINTATVPEVRSVRVPKVCGEVQGPELSVSVPHKTANRRSRDAYNEYMRDYMRKKRGA